MSETENLNNMIGIFNKLGLENNASGIPEVFDSSLVCIDTSNHRIGINTIDPSYEIHVNQGTIKTENFIVNNNFSKFDISTNIDICGNINLEGIIDISNSKIKFIIPKSETGDGINISQIYYNNDGVLKIKF